MSVITNLHASQRLDSRGNPTVRILLTTSHGIFPSIVPSGASVSSYEALELRDNDSSLYAGKSVLGAVRNANDVILPALQNANIDLGQPGALRKVDELMKELDGTPNKSKLGANAILGVSMATARACAAARGVPLYEFLRLESGAKAGPYVMPVPFFNVINGGVHAGNDMAFQEFMVAPVGAGSMEEAVRLGAEVYHALKDVIKSKFGGAATAVGDEGGFAPPISGPRDAFAVLMEAVQKAGHTGEIKFGLDPASSEFLKEDKGYDLGFKTGREGQILDAAGLGELYRELVKEFPVVLLEDPFAQDDWEGWSRFKRDCGTELEVVGDDLLATNSERIMMAVERKACNALLLKVNQIGSVTEAIDAANLAYSKGWSVFVSHRSGDTTDDFIADLTVGLRTGHLKSGAPCRGERVAKYNRLMDIEEEIKRLGGLVCYAGAQFRTMH